jgi:hypothetical protein
VFSVAWSVWAGLILANILTKGSTRWKVAYFPCILCVSLRPSKWVVAGSSPAGDVGRLVEEHPITSQTAGAQHWASEYREVTAAPVYRAVNEGALVVLAPAGLVAINVGGGQTVHSFFKFKPRFTDVRKIRPARDTRIIRPLQTVVIDDLSMVRAT